MRQLHGYRIWTLNINCLVNPSSKLGLLEFLRRNDPDLLCLQEVNLLQPELSDMIKPLRYNCYCNVTETGRGTAILWKETFIVTNQRTIVPDRLMSIDFGLYTLINVYGPSGRARRQDRADLYSTNLNLYLAGIRNRIKVLGGDFNCIVEKRDAKNNPGQKMSKELKVVLMNNDMIDAYRHVNPATDGFTFIRKNSASRIDRLYVSRAILNSVTAADLIPTPSSDHNAVLIEINDNVAAIDTNEQSKRHTYWKLNNQVLSNPDFEVNFQHLYRRLLLRKQNFVSVTEWWEKCTKPLFRHFLINFSKQLSKEKHDTKDALYHWLKDSVDKGMEGYEETVEIKAKIQDIYETEMEGFKVRSRFKENLEKEKGSLFHLAREKKNGKLNNLEKILIDDVVVTDKKLIEGKVMGHFDSLFNGKLGRDDVFIMDEEKVDELLNDKLGQITDVDKETISQPFSMAELEFVFKNLPNNKSPGLDGLSNEFYKKVFPTIKNEYLEIQNQYQDLECISKEMRKGVTRLIPKEDGLIDINKFRPLTILIPDYSIKSRLMTNRLNSCMDDIIKSGQLCGSTGPNIQTGVHNILSTIEFVNQKNLPGALLSFDLSKAFDRCFIPFVCKTMKKMNFPDKFINIVKDMHAEITTCFILNGLSPEISLTFSIRQGDPIAMHLFTVYMEPFLVNLSPVCRGIRMGEVEEVDEPYADDVELLVEKEEDFAVIDKLFKTFEAASGAVLSRSEKSKVMGLGTWKNRVNWPLAWLQPVQQMKVFGFIICQNYNDTLNKNWAIALSSFRKVLMSFDLRSLNTLHQRVDVVNIFASSKLWYKAAVLPLPGSVAKDLEISIGKFLWKGKLERLTLVELCNKKVEGGLGLVEIRSKADALLLKQACRILTACDSKSWLHLKYWMGLYLSKIIPQMRTGPHSERIPRMYTTTKALLDESVLELPLEDISKITVKELYQSFTETLPPPKIIYKRGPGVVWDNVWTNLNHPMLRVKEREMMFLIAHNILPTKERLYRMKMIDSNMCSCGGGVESLEHIFFTCVKSQSAWSWMRRKMESVVPATRLFSDQDLLRLDFQSKTFLFFINFYFSFIWKNIKVENISVINIDKIEAELKSEFRIFQNSQNRFENMVI